MKPLKDYSFIRGMCHNQVGDDQETLERELGYAKRLNLNSVRFWLNQEEYEKDPEKFLRRQRNFMETCYKFGISSMPILWNGNFFKDFKTPTEAEYKKMYEYAKAFIDEFRDEEYILMWDVINEPMCNDYTRKCKPEEYGERYEILKKHVRRLCEIVRSIDPVGCMTVGHEKIAHIESSEDLVDVISYHDYLTTRKEVENTITEAEKIGERLGKPIINTETGCVGRSNPYDIEIELSQKHNVGFYLFCLVSRGFWGDIHGLVYPDGTIRDPATIAALYGFFRKRTPGRIFVDPNREGYAYNAVRAVENVLKISEDTLFKNKQRSAEEILEAAEYCVNVLEGAEMVPMWDAPSAKIEIWRHTPEEELNLLEIKRFAYDMAKLLREKCMF